MLRGIDEDLVRQRQSRSQSEQSGSERIANEALREEIALYIVQASDIVPAAELCAAFDISDQHLRNQMRALRKAGRVVIVRGGYAVGRTVAKSSSITSSTRLS
jgi:DeoR/GlpR family transcriptional regulator of sugar metabolism